MASHAKTDCAVVVKDVAASDSRFGSHFISVAWSGSGQFVNFRFPHAKFVAANPEHQITSGIELSLLHTGQPQTDFRRIVARSQKQIVLDAVLRAVDGSLHAFCGCFCSQEVWYVSSPLQWVAADEIIALA